MIIIWAAKAAANLPAHLALRLAANCPQTAHKMSEFVSLRTCVTLEDCVRVVRIHTPCPQTARMHLPANRTHAPARKAPAVCPDVIARSAQYPADGRIGHTRARKTRKRGRKLPALARKCSAKPLARKLSAKRLEEPEVAAGECFVHGIWRRTPQLRGTLLERGIQHLDGLANHPGRAVEGCGASWLSRRDVVQWNTLKGSIDEGSIVKPSTTQGVIPCTSRCKCTAQALRTKCCL
eukprot:gene17725-biopygen13263